MRLIPFLILPVIGVLLVMCLMAVSQAPAQFAWMFAVLALPIVGMMVLWGKEAIEALSSKDKWLD